MKQKLCMAVALALLILVLPETVLAASVPLKVGDKSWKVKVTQQKLNVVGINTEITGNFSKDTEKALKDFQQKNKLKVTGLLDDVTYQKVIKAAFEKEGIRGISGKEIITTAAKYKGVPYKFGGTTPKAFDCSGYVQYVFGQHKARLPRLADAQCLEGIFVLKKDLKEGDLVFFTTYEPGASHVGIYAGKDKFWNASSHGVMLSSLKEKYWSERYYGARRVLAYSDNLSK